MKWSICLPCYKNYTEVWFTVQSLRMHHDMKDKEIVLVDNYAYVVDLDDGLEIIDIGNRTNPVEIGQFTDGGSPLSIFQGST